MLESNLAETRSGYWQNTSVERDHDIHWFVGNERNESRKEGGREGREKEERF
jgi:hypothetical protein